MNGTSVAAGLRVLVVTVVHDPQDARIRFRQIVALLAAGAVVTYAAPFTAYGRDVPDGVRGIDLPRARGRRRLAAVRAARRVLRREAAAHHVVLLHDPELLLAVPGLPRHRDGGSAGSGGPVVVWDVHEDTAAALGMKGWLPAPLRGPVGIAVRVLEAYAERRCRLLLAEEGYRARFRREHPVVPNSVLVPADEPPPPGTDRVVYLGRLTRARGAEDLVELGRLLAPQVRVELIGNADAEVAGTVARAHAAGHVVHHGFVPNADALRLLDGALAGLSLLHDEPNYAHSRPTKIMEYMAHGVPVISTPNPVSVDLVDRYGCGVIVPFADPAAAAAAITELRRDADRRHALGSAGRDAAVRDLNWADDGRRFAAHLAGLAHTLLPPGSSASTD